MERQEQVVPEWISPDLWDPATVTRAPYAKCKVGNPGKKRKRKIRDVLCAFDIETSHVPGREDAMLYHWQLQIGIGNPTIHGRTWDDLRLMFSRLREALGEKDKLLIFVHNLSFEWQHLRTIYDFQNDEIFAVGDRKILKCTMYDGALEFRCSYLLTNMSLSAWTKRMQVEHPKLDSEGYDHEQIRWPWDELTEEELRYCRHDVLGLCEALQVQLARDRDTLETVPHTSTGYVRRDVKAVMRTWSYWSLQAVQPDADVYRVLREEFRGGDTHANRYFAGDLVTGVKSMDRSSSYPDVIVNCRFPMGKFRRWIRLCDAERKRLLSLDKALLMRVRFYNIRLIHPTLGDPPLSFSKCRRVIGQCLDNGRILRAAVLETTINDIDWIVYSQAYGWDRVDYLDCWYSSYDYLPDQLRDLVITYYRRKTELKGVAGQELYYDLAKALLNSIYGLQAQDICKQDIIFNGVNFEPGPEDLEGKLAKNKHKAYGSYAWGCWTTAWARLRLWEGIYGDGRPDHPGVGRDYVYGDTDSIKYIGDHDLSWYNELRIQDSRANGAYATDPQGVTHYMGVFEEETGRDGYKLFRTWGSKKYCYVDQEGRTHITVAGVGKKKGAAELDLAGGIEAFKPGMVWSDAGGTVSKYNDLTREVITVGEHSVELGPNIYIAPSTYTLGVTDEYSAVIEDPAAYLDFLSDKTNFDYFEHDYI